MIKNEIFRNSTRFYEYPKNLRDKHDYSLHIGKDFWHRLTGDESFYSELSKAIAEVAMKAKGVELIEEVVSILAQKDEIKKLAGSNN